MTFASQEKSSHVQRSKAHSQCCTQPQSAYTATACMSIATLDELDARHRFSSLNHVYMQTQSQCICRQEASESAMLPTYSGLC